MNEMVVLLSKVGWSRAEFARQIGASANTVGSWCQGKNDSVAYRLAVKYLHLKSILDVVR
jgi:DNA-binding transcriptional regulator YiaG